MNSFKVSVLGLLLPACAAQQQPAASSQSSYGQRSARADAISAMTNQAELARVVREEQDTILRVTAAKRITDVSLQAELAHDAEGWQLEDALLRGLDSWPASSIVRLAKSAKSSQVREKMLWVTNDQALLAQVAKSDADASVRETAVRRLTDQAVITALAADAALATDARIVALHAATDQEVLATAACSSASSEVRAAALWNLSTEQVLIRLRNDPDEQVSRGAVRRLSNRRELVQIALSDPRAEMREESLHRLAGLSQRETPLDPSLSKSLLPLITKDPQAPVRAAALQLVGNEALAREALRKDSSSTVRAAAVDMVTSAKALEEAACDREEYVRSRALGALTKLGAADSIARVAEFGETADGRIGALDRIRDPQVILRIANKDGDPNVRAAAQKVLDRPLEIRGVLKGAAAKTSVYFIPADVGGGGVRMSVTMANGFPAHPGGEAQGNGKFLISVPRAALASGKTFTLGIIDGGGHMGPLQVDGQPVVLRIQEPILEIEIGSISTVYSTQ